MTLDLRMTFVCLTMVLCTFLNHKGDSLEVTLCKALSRALILSTIDFPSLILPRVDALSLAVAVAPSIVLSQSCLHLISLKCCEVVLQKIPLQIRHHLFLTIVIVKDKLTDLWGTWLMQNYFNNTLCEIKLDSIQSWFPSGRALSGSGGGAVGLISQNVLIEWFQKVNSPTKSLTCWLQLLMKS